MENLTFASMKPVSFEDRLFEPWLLQHVLREWLHTHSASNLVSNYLTISVMLLNLLRHPSHAPHCDVSVQSDDACAEVVAV